MAGHLGHAGCLYGAQTRVRTGQGEGGSELRLALVAQALLEVFDGAARVAATALDVRWWLAVRLLLEVSPVLADDASTVMRSPLRGRTSTR